jgi:mono/diheme cytochrome c family protein
LPPPATTVGADAAKLYDFITKQSPYTSWQLWPGTTKFYTGRAPHGALLTTYVNDIAASSVQSQNGMANGSIIIKENYMSDKTLAALTVMYKITGYNPAAGDWFWADYTPAGAVQASGKVDMCIGCHGLVKDNELLFTANVTNGGAVPSPGTTVAFSTRVQSIFNAKCTVCHNISGIAPFLPLVPFVSYGNLVNQFSTKTGTPPSGILVVPGNSAGSVLYQRISGVGLPAGAAQMPLGGPPLNSGDQNIIKAWIDQGAGNN